MAIDVMAPYDAPKEEKLQIASRFLATVFWDEKNIDIMNFFPREQ